MLDLQRQQRAQVAEMAQLRSSHAQDQAEWNDKLVEQQEEKDTNFAALKQQHILDNAAWTATAMVCHSCTSVCVAYCSAVW